MTIHKPPPSLDAIRNFIGEAPDSPREAPPLPSPSLTSPTQPIHRTGTDESGAEKAAGVIRGNKQVVTVGFTRTLLPQIDTASDMLNISRAAFINMACTRFIKEVYRDYLREVEAQAKQ